MVPPNEGFNVEKEHKVINPHRMELSTTNKTNYNAFKVQPKVKEQRVAQQNDAPMIGTSTYSAGFPNWKNGQQDVYHEKHP